MNDILCMSVQANLHPMHQGNQWSSETFRERRNVQKT